MTYMFNENGAVTVDWVVLTAGLVGLGLATMTVVSSGVQDTAGDIDAQLKGQGAFDAIATSFFYGNTVYSGDFEAGADGFWGTTSDQYAFLGGTLVPEIGDGSETLGQTFDIPEGATEARITLDVYAMDSLDNFAEGHPSFGAGQLEGPRLYVGGVEVARGYPSLNNPGGSNLVWEYHDVPGISVESSLVKSGQLGGYGSWQDSQHQVTITVSDPEATLDVGFGFLSDGQDVGGSEYREGVAFDNVRVEAR